MGTNSEASWSEWMTTGLMVLIAIGMVLAVWMILRRSRGSRPTGALPGDPREVEFLRQEAERLAEPPPLAADPVPAAAPLEASPATLAADLVEPLPDSGQRPAPVAASPVAPEPVAIDAPDDLTRIKGLGPKLALTLGELGVTRYAQIAELTPDQARVLDAQLGAFQGRMERDRWIEQAGYLARGDRDGFEAAFGKL